MSHYIIESHVHMVYANCLVDVGGAADVRIMAGKILGALCPTSVWLCKAKATDLFVGLLVVRPWARWAWTLLGRRSRVYAVQGRSRSQMIAHSCTVQQCPMVELWHLSLSYTQIDIPICCAIWGMIWHDMTRICPSPWRQSIDLKGVAMVSMFQVKKQF